MVERVDKDATMRKRFWKGPYNPREMGEKNQGTMCTPGRTVVAFLQLSLAAHHAHTAATACAIDFQTASGMYFVSNKSAAARTSRPYLSPTAGNVDIPSSPGLNILTHPLIAL